MEIHKIKSSFEKAGANALAFLFLKITHLYTFKSGGESSVKKGTDNLRTPTTEEARIIGAKGGVASGKARREKKLLRETLETLIDMSVKPGQITNIEDVKAIATLKGKNISVQEVIMLAQVQKAMKGDTKAAEYIRDTIGQKPDSKVDLKAAAVPIVIKDDVTE